MSGSVGGSGGDARRVDDPTVAAALREAAERIGAAGSPSPRLDAELLLAHILGLKREGLFREPERRLSVDEAARFTESVARRAQREPVAYIIGHKPFRTIDVGVDSSVIVPRPDTETLIEVALDYLRSLSKPQPLALDLCTGSGAVALALCAEHPTVRVIATDIGPRALELARGNAVRLGLGKRIDFEQSDLFDDLPLGGHFDLILSNPPYIRADEIEHLQEEVRRWEPREALVSGPGGLEFYERIIPGALPYLGPGGLLAVEIHEERADDVASLFRATGCYQEIRVHNDLGGSPRVVSGRDLSCDV